MRHSVHFSLLCLSVLGTPGHAATRVAMIDSGIDLSHPAFAGRIVGGHDYIDDDGVPADSIGHGTQMAGLIAAAGEVTGACPSCELSPYRVAGVAGYGAGGEVDPSLPAQAIEDAIADGADVIYVGVGFAGGQSALVTAVADAEAAGIPVIAPAGSTDLQVTLYPAALPTVISVIAADSTGDLLLFTGTSGREMTAALGEDLATTDLDGGEARASGSSAAAAWVAGLVGQALTENPALAPAQLRQIVRYGSTPLATPRWCETFETARAVMGLALARTASDLVDVAVARPELEPAAPLGGEPNALRIVVVNHGNTPLAAATLSVSWGMTPINVSVPPLGLDETRSATLVVPLPTAAPGSDVLITASLPGLPGEIELGDNTIAIVAHYGSTPTHDVALDVGPLSEPVLEEGMLEIPVHVRNRGNQDEPSVTVQLLVDGGVEESHLLALAAGAETTLVGAVLMSLSTASRVRTLAVTAEIASADEDPDNNSWLFDYALGTRADLGRLQYADTGGHPDLVIDAPWRTRDDTVPVLLFLPDFEEGYFVLDWLVRSRVKRFSIYPYDPATGARGVAPLVVDNRAGADQMNGTTAIGDLGQPLAAGLPAERLHRFWHYILRVPHAALGVADEPPDYHYLWCEVEYDTRVLWLPRRTATAARVLRVLFDGAPFPRFDAADRYYDVHVHTIAEQTAGQQVLSPIKNFGGPISMLLESSRALGLIDTQLGNANWADFKNKLVVTDHNVFYSDIAGESPASAPGYGPTAGNPANERNWYRTNLGRLAGEEVALQSQNQSPAYGHHFLVYDSDHIEGPWQGGRLLNLGVPNPNTLEAVLTAMKGVQQGDGFGYAAHPRDPILPWPPEYFRQAIAGRDTSRTGPQVGRTGKDFLFKGSQFWNGKAERWSRVQRMNADREFVLINPFRPAPADPKKDSPQRFVANANWTRELDQGLTVYYEQVRLGLSYAFREAKKERFLRKVYMSGGSDAHGDFNYTDDVTATNMSGSRGSLSSNAYGRVRTYTLVHDLPASDGDAELKSQDAYRDGNTVVTDGPLCRMSLDAGGRHDPGAGAARWHDATEAYENADGQIGGLGSFDGGRTMLVVKPGKEVWIKSQWKKSISPGAGAIDSFRVLQRGAATGNPLQFRVGAGAADQDKKQAYGKTIGENAAVILEARDETLNERCMTNPIWAVSVDIQIDAPAACPIPANGLTVTFTFPISMMDTTVTKAFIRPLDGTGTSTNPEVQLAAAPGWQEANGVKNGKYTAKNAAAIPCPEGDWDAEQHQAAQGQKSYVVYLVKPTDLHANVLNDIAKTFMVGLGTTGVHAMVEQFDWEPSPRGVTLRFSRPIGSSSDRVRLYRWDSVLGERLLAELTATTEGGAFTDEDVRPGELYRYRLGIFEHASEVAGPTLELVLPPPPVALDRMRPNPVGRAGTIAWSQPRVARARILVYSVSGQLEQVLKDGAVEPGFHHMAWTGKDAKGRGFAPGVYYLVLEVEGQRRTQSFVVLH